MLKDTLYKIISLDHNGHTISAHLELDKDNEIFIGHFPSQPVLPGACMLQMVKEVFSIALNQPLKMKKADQLKFLRLVDPQINCSLLMELTYVILNKRYEVTGNIKNENEICFKIKGTFVTA